MRTVKRTATVFSFDRLMEHEICPWIQYKSCRTRSPHKNTCFGWIKRSDTIFDTAVSAALQLFFYYYYYFVFDYGSDQACASARRRHFYDEQLYPVWRWRLYLNEWIAAHTSETNLNILDRIGIGCLFVAQSSHQFTSVDGIFKKKKNNETRLPKIERISNENFAANHSCMRLIQSSGA